MATILIIGPHRFFFYSSDREEPPHIHVERERMKAKFTLDDETLTVNLSDGRTILIPLAWYPRLFHATPAERNNWRLIGEGEGIHWSDLDEDIRVEGLILGKASGESQRSLKEWLEQRRAQGKSS
jgi:hypothetical protein